MKQNIRTRIEINAGCQELPKITNEAWEAIKARNHPHFLFRQFGRIVRLEYDDGGNPFLQPMSEHRMRHTLARVADWYGFNRQGSKIPAKPPVAAVRDLMASPDPPLPVVERIVDVPVFGADGTLCTTPGYHLASRTLYIPRRGLVLKPVSSNPTDREIAEAKNLIEFELHGDFPLQGASDKAGAVALVLHPFGTSLFRPSPIHLVHKPAPATGGTLLVMVSAIPGLGDRVACMPPVAEDERHPAYAEEEWRKRITAVLRTCPALVLIDNVRSLASGALSAAITAPVWEDRILGGSEVGRFPVKCAWVATGNNPRISHEIATRCISIRLDAQMDDPGSRTNFRHPNIVSWAMANRAALVWAAHTLITAWIARGRPVAPGRPRLGRFETWSDCMGGILAVAGIPGFLEDVNTFHEESNPEREVYLRFVKAWWLEFQTRAVGTAELFPLAVEVFDLGNGGEHSQRIRLGKLLLSLRDRQFDGKTILGAGSSRGAQLWVLLPRHSPSAND